MAIKFRCPNCRTALGTADDKAGKQATCPGCGGSVTVPEAAGNSDDPAQVRFRNHTGVWCQGCGVESSPEADFCDACGRPLAAPAVVHRSESLDFGDIATEAVACWQRELLLLTLGALVIAILSLLAQAPLRICVTLMQQGNVSGALVLLTAGAYLFLVSVSAFLTLGQMRMTLNAVRGERVAFSDLFSQGRQVPTALLDGLAMFLLSLVASVPGSLVLMAGLMLGQDSPALFVLGTVVGGACLAAAWLILPQLFWATPFRIVDGVPGLAPLRGSYRYTQRRPGLTGLLLLSAFGLTVAGYMMCCIGLLLTLPLTMTIYAVAYDRMRDQLR